MHKFTTDITRRFHTIGIEQLNVKGMMRNQHLSRAISDMGFFEVRRQLIYKAAMRGGVVIVADRWFASSKICSACGHKLESLPLSMREWVCPACGSVHDRDVNAAVNLKNMAVSSTASACGGAGSDDGRQLRVKPASMKQEAICEPVQAGCTGMAERERIRTSDNYASRRRTST
jgi:putative transposase